MRIVSVRSIKLRQALFISTVGMCLGFAYVSSRPSEDGFKVVLAFNREERLDRPTARVAWWEDKQILGGRDLVTGGTWLAMDESGRIAFVTNIQDPNCAKKSSGVARLRGALAVEYLTQDLEAKEYVHHLEKEVKKEANMKSFNLCILEPTQDEDGIYKSRLLSFDGKRTQKRSGDEFIGISNNPFQNKPFAKTNAGMAAFKRIVRRSSTATADHLLDQLAALMSDERQINPSCKTLRRLFPTEEEARAFSSIFVKAGCLGTKSQAFVLVDAKGRVTFEERVALCSGEPPRRFRFST